MLTISLSVLIASSLVSLLIITLLVHFFLDKQYNVVKKSEIEKLNTELSNLYYRNPYGSLKNLYEYYEQGNRLVKAYDLVEDENKKEEIIKSLKIINHKLRTQYFNTPLEEDLNKISEYPKNLLSTEKATFL